VFSIVIILRIRLISLVIRRDDHFIKLVVCRTLFLRLEMHTRFDFKDVHFRGAHGVEQTNLGINEMSNRCFERFNG